MGAHESGGYAAFAEQAERFFNQQLERIGLAKHQIDSLETAELEDSLSRVEDALRAPESFGVLRLKMTANAGLIVTSNSEAHIEIGVVPLLLERKKAITERLRSFRNTQPIKTISDLLDSLTDPRVRERLRTELEAIRHANPKKSASMLRPNHAFVAMAMDPEEPQLEDVLDAVKAGAEKCGIKAERIDEAVSNEPITARMLKAIEEAEFVVVDITRPRANVFYEAGFAQGLGKTPVYIARKGSESPFDVKDHPVSQYTNMHELRTLLAERLSAVRAGRI